MCKSRKLSCLHVQGHSLQSGERKIDWLKLLQTSSLPISFLVPSDLSQQFFHHGQKRTIMNKQEIRFICVNDNAVVLLAKQCSTRSDSESFPQFFFVYYVLLNSKNRQLDFAGMQKCLSCVMQSPRITCAHGSPIESFYSLVLMIVVVFLFFCPCSISCRFYLGLKIIRHSLFVAWDSSSRNQPVPCHTSWSHPHHARLCSYLHCV